ncbi:MAG: DUF1302 domain-containing protein [Burkholderiales bacterium]|nr:DUF1302 domain-containing protein [Burkholderiales bacterium]
MDCSGNNAPKSQELKPRAMTSACKLLCMTLGVGYLGAVNAAEFSLDNGIEGHWSLNMSLGTSWRATGVNKALVATGNGGLSGGANDDGDLNFEKGKTFSTIGKMSGEVLVKRDNLGLVIGGTAWYDYAAKHDGVPHGSFANAYVPGARLDDSGFDSRSKFSGAALGNAYVFGNFDLDANHPLNVKLGNQVVNWGESLFIPGINHYGTFDITAAHRPGAEVKDILLPIPQIFASLGLAKDLTVEGFYQFNWKKSVLDGCGTYWSPANVVNCSNGTLVGGDALPSMTQYNGDPALGGLNYRLGRASDQEAKNSGQFGLAARYFASSISTEFGAYYVNYHQRFPVVSLSKTPSAGNSIWSGALAPFGGPSAAQYFFDYSGENIHALGLSAATQVKGWTVSGEASYTEGVPVQINGPDLFVGNLAGVGPMASLKNLPAGSVIHGYDRKNKSQLQVSTLKIFPQVAGAESLTMVGEIGFQHWSGIGDSATSTRYGRDFVYGFAQTAAIPCAFTGNANKDFCENKGFVTSNAWGYRLLAELSYPDAFAGVNLKPRLFWAHDVKGYSADVVFSEGRQVLGLGVRADYNNKYYADFSYTRFNHNATYHVQNDRDYFSMVAGIKF